MKPKWRGWKEGTITEDLISGGGSLEGKKPEHKKGDLVRYKRYKNLDEKGIWHGKYEWHYINLDNFELVRSSRLIIDCEKV